MRTKNRLPNGTIAIDRLGYVVTVTAPNDDCSERVMVKVAGKWCDQETMRHSGDLIPLKKRHARIMRVIARCF